ncbi:hypothetical protein D3C86_1927420 [compost metagenome]
MLSCITNKIQEAYALEPIVVIQHFSRIGLCGIKIEEFFQLLSYAFLVKCQYFFTQKVSFFAFTCGVTNHASSPAYKGHGFMSGSL